MLLSGSCKHALLTNVHMTVKQYAHVIQKMKYGYIGFNGVAIFTVALS